MAEGNAHWAIAAALFALTHALDRLGNGNAATPMGAIEALGMHIGEKLERLADALESRDDP
jgi:hypothetical protein